MEAQEIRVGDFSEINGGIVENSKYTHLAHLNGLTACGKAYRLFMMGYTFFVDCPDCLSEMQYRVDHPETKKTKFGITHKELYRQE